MTTGDWVGSFARDLAGVPNVAGVVLGGSRARGTQNDLSDYDIGVYYHGDIDPEAVAAVIARYHDEGEELTVTAPGEWGPWINGGAWFKAGGVKADLLYRETGRVAEVIAAAREGEFTSHYQIGHPAGYYSYMLMAEAGVFRPLADADGTLARLKESVTPYPDSLRRAITEKFMFEADFQLGILERAGKPGDLFFVQAGQVRVVSCLVQVIYALNEAWFVNEKRAVEQASGMDLVPAGFGERVRAALTGDPAGLSESRALLADTDVIVQSVLPREQ
jgi:hypothetical protein